jgi:hypothetical protein
MLSSWEEVFDAALIKLPGLATIAHWRVMASHIIADCSFAYRLAGDNN